MTYGLANNGHTKCKRETGELELKSKLSLMEGNVTMKSAAAFASIIALFMMVFTVPALCFEISIDISPSTLNLEYQGTVVTVHTDIPYYYVEGATVELNGIEIAWWKSDNRGNFVAKFNADNVKPIVTPGSNMLTLTGETKEGETFTGSGTITVVDNTGSDGWNKARISLPAIRTFQRRVPPSGIR